MSLDSADGEMPQAFSSEVYNICLPKEEDHSPASLRYERGEALDRETWDLVAQGICNALMSICIGVLVRPRELVPCGTGQMAAEQKLGCSE